jgi:hypothetical protein
MIGESLDSLHDPVLKGEVLRPDIEVPRCGPYDDGKICTLTDFELRVRDVLAPRVRPGTLGEEGVKETVRLVPPSDGMKLSVPSKHDEAAPCPVQAGYGAASLYLKAAALLLFSRQKNGD